MKNLIAPALVGVVLATSSAMAADMPLKAPPPAPPPAPAYDWSGFYASFAPGWEQTTANWAFTNPASKTLTPFSERSTDAIFGASIGAQYQYQWLVIGAEVGASVLSQGTSASAVGNGAGIGQCAATNTCTARISSAIETAGGRIGLAWNQLLFYGEGGWATAQTQTHLLSPGGATLDTTQGTNNGTYVGGGVDWMWLTTGTLKGVVGLEYQHINFNNAFETSSLDNFNPAGANARNVGANVDIVRARLTLLVDPFAPWTHKH